MADAELVEVDEEDGVADDEEDEEPLTVPSAELEATEEGVLIGELELDDVGEYEDELDADKVSVDDEVELADKEPDPELLALPTADQALLLP